MPTPEDLFDLGPKDPPLFPPGLPPLFPPFTPPQLPPLVPPGLPPPLFPLPPGTTPPGKPGNPPKTPEIPKKPGQRPDKTKGGTTRSTPRGQQTTSGGGDIPGGGGGSSNVSLADLLKARADAVNGEDLTKAKDPTLKCAEAVCKGLEPSLKEVGVDIGHHEDTRDLDAAMKNAKYPDGRPVFEVATNDATEGEPGDVIVTVRADTIVDGKGYGHAGMYDSKGNIISNGSGGGKMFGLNKNYWDRRISSRTNPETKEKLVTNVYRPINY